MKTYLECIPCFFRQALETSKIAGADEIKQKKILDKLAKIIPEFKLSSSPPEMGRTIYKLIAEITGETDPFKKIKEEDNKFALNLYPELKMKVKNSKDRLLTAIKLAIAGNIIDHGVKTSLEIKEEINNFLNSVHNKYHNTIFDYNEFKEKLNNTKSILYLADNAGEVVFDKVLIEELNSRGKQVLYVVRGKPVLNDALIEDARICGIDKVGRIISSGVDAPGTILNLCSKEFLELYKDAEMIISKGQGNFEALNGEEGQIFFLLKAKCPVIAKDIGCKMNSIVLKSNNAYTRAVTHNKN